MSGAKRLIVSEATAKGKDANAMLAGNLNEMAGKLVTKKQ